MPRREWIVAALAMAAVARAAPLDLGEQRAVAARTRDQIAAKLEEQDRGLRERVRLLYKLSAHGDLALWVDESARHDALLRRGAARRLILRDLEERHALRAEFASVDHDLERLDEAARRADARPLHDHILVRPTRGDVVASFGPYKDERTHVRLQRRGIEMAAGSGEVVAAGAGTVSFAGPLRGLGLVVVVDHGQGLLTITTGLGAVRVGRGDRVAAGEPVGRAAGPRIGFEARHGGRVVDPYPLLAAKR